MGGAKIFYFAAGNTVKATKGVGTKTNPHHDGKTNSFSPKLF